MIPNHGHISERLQPGRQLRPARWPHSTHNHKYEHERGACFFCFLLDIFFLPMPVGGNTSNFD